MGLKASVHTVALLCIPPEGECVGSPPWPRARRETPVKKRDGGAGLRRLRNADAGPMEIDGLEASTTSGPQAQTGPGYWPRLVNGTDKSATAIDTNEFSAGM